MNIWCLAMWSFLLLAFQPTIFGQTTNKDISQIRKVFSQINSDSQLKKFVIKGEDFLDHTPDGGASLTGYFSKDKLVKISEWIGLSFGIRQTDYYYDSANLIFCYVSELHFQTTDSGLNYNKTEPVLEVRYYYMNNRLIQKRLKGSGFWDKKDESGLLPDSREYSKLLISKKAKAK
jgi:hypothetical protein